MKFKHKPKEKEGDIRTKTRFAYFPVTCRSSKNSSDIETRWAEVVTTRQQLKMLGTDESTASLCWIDLYFIDDEETNRKD